MLLFKKSFFLKMLFKKAKKRHLKFVNIVSKFTYDGRLAIDVFDVPLLNILALTLYQY